MYDKLASVYDFFVDWKTRLEYEMPFILEQLGQLGDDHAQLKIMDAACGTGQHAIALSKEDYQVFGSDLFPQMVTQAALNAKAADQQIIFKTAGFGHIASIFETSRPFDAVLCLGNSLPHVQSTQELHSALKDFANLLKPGGLLLLQSRNFDQIMLSRQRWMEPQTYQADNEEWLFFRFYDFEPSGMIQFNILTLNRHKPETWQVKLTSTHLLPLLSEVLKDTLTQTCFKDLRLFGNMKAETYNSQHSGDLIILATKA